ncbi:MAG: MerR family transcriptional regulator [Proteobacteria bacterium]|nr:MerR family transcriptional regulator [Burkholderiales bacterium]
MNIPITPDTAAYSIHELSVLVDLPPRTVRYYVQIGLVDHPEGGTRAAKYGTRHLEQLLLVRKWTASGLSLERIRELLHGEPPPVEARARVAGSVEVCSHLHVSDGIEVVIEPSRAGLSPEQVRRLIRGVMALMKTIRDDEVAADKPGREPQGGAPDQAEG